MSVDAMRAIRTLIVDDELAAREGIRHLLAADPEIVVAGECANGRDAAAAIRDGAPDLVFLDVQMPELDGFEVLREVGVERAPAVVFVTAFDQYALRAFDVHAIDYLLKPFTDERFRQSLERAKQQVRHGRLGELSQKLAALLGPGEPSRAARPRYLDRLLVKSGGKVTLLPVGEIDWIDAEGDYVRIHVGKTWHLLRETMKNLEGQLDPTDQARCIRTGFWFCGRGSSRAERRSSRPRRGSSHFCSVSWNRSVAWRDTRSPPVPRRPGGSIMRLIVRSVFAAAALGMLVVSRAPAQEPVTITGKVSSDGGLPLGQVEIAIPVMGPGALSKDDGSYTIVVPGARVSGQTVTLVARRLGYKSQSAQVTLTAGGVTHDFVLAANPLQLGEVVVTGAGTTTSTEKLGNVRNSVGADVIAKAGEANMVQALAGKAPNVTVIQQSGDPGAGSFINIRGTSSILGSNQPLFVVDGVPMDNSTFSTSNFLGPEDAGGTLVQVGQTEGTVATNRAADLNPNDIESVEILKGPAASAIYGARAAAGVVLITTKSGRSGPTHFTFRSSTAFNDINHGYPLQTSFGLGSRGVHADTSLGGTCDQPGSGICGRSWGPAIPAGGAVFDHANELYRVGHTLDNGFTVSGGNDRTTFYLSGGNTYDQGVIIGPNDYFSRTSVRFKGSHRVADNLRLGGDLAFADSRAKYLQRGNNTNGLQLGDLRTPPDFDNHPYFVITPNGTLQQRSYRLQHPTDASLLDDRTFDNPLWTIFQAQSSSNVGRVYGNVNAEYLATPWLKVTYTLGADYATDERLEGCAQTSAAPCIAGRVIEGKIVNYAIDHNLTATATYTLNPGLGGTVTLGQNLNTRNQRQLGDVGRTLVAPQPFKASNTVSRDPVSDQEQVIHDASWFGQGTLDIKSQLYLTAAVRNDGSSTFGRSNLRSWFPKGSAAWEFTKALGERAWLSYGKARVAYGEAGIEPLP